MSLQDYYQGFSCPDQGLDEEFLEIVAGEHAREITCLFLDRHGATLADKASGVRELLERWASTEIAFDQSWSLALGLVEATLTTTFDGDPAPAAAGLALAIANGSSSSEWCCEFDTPTRLRTHDVLLPACERIEVEGSTGDRSIRLRCEGDEVVLTADPRAGQRSDSLPTLNTGGDEIVLLPAAALTGFRIEQFPAAPVARIDDRVVESCREALSLLDQAVPEYHTWVCRILRHFVPLQGGPGSLVSGSTAQYYGTTYLCLDVEPAAIGEMLVHEGSHQYYHILTWLGPVDDGSDETLYYSPVKRKGRPIAYILLAYHAFANVMLYYQRCRMRDIGSEARTYCLENEKRLWPQLDELEAHLRSARSLTPLGAALWEPLAAAMGELER